QVEVELRRIRQLHQEDLVGGDGPDRGRRRRPRERMETVEDDADRLVIGAPHDLPSVAIITHMPPPGERLEADAQVPLGRQFAKRMEIRGSPVDAAQRSRRHIAADQQKVGLELAHQVELALGPGEAARALRFGHALEIAERLERTDLKAKVAAELCDLGRVSGEGEQIVLEDLDRLESRGSNRAQLLVQRARKRDGGDRTLAHAALSSMTPPRNNRPISGSFSTFSALSTRRVRPSSRGCQAAYEASRRAAITRSNASPITDTDGESPVNNSNASAAWQIASSRPVMMRAPLALAASNSGVNNGE